MKLSNTLLLIFFTYSVQAQGISEVEGRWQRIEVIEQEGSAAELYNKMREWVTINYNSAQDVIQYESEEEKKIIVKGLFEIPFIATTAHVYHMLTLEARENRYRVSFDQFIYNGGGDDFPFEGKLIRGKKVRSDAGKEVDSAILSLKDYVSKEKEEW